MKRSSMLKNQKRDAETQLRNYRWRKKQLEDICNDMYGCFEDCAGDISYCSSHVRTSMSWGILLEGGGTTPENLFKNEEGICDYNLSQSRNYIVAEINAVNNKISELESDSARLSSSIRTAENREREELRRKTHRA